MKTDIWLPIYIGDYLKDTMHLSTEEHGAYFLILMDLWMKGGWIKMDKKHLSRICRVPLDHFEKEIWPTIGEFFREDEAGITQDRLLKELEKSQNNRKIAKSNGDKGGRPRTQNKPTGKPTGKPKANPDYNPDPNLNETSSPSPSPSPKQTTKPKIKKEHLFHKSEFYDKSKWIEELKDWSEEKALDYWERANGYSLSKGAKYLNWIQAVKAWERKEKKDNGKNNSGYGNGYNQQQQDDERIIAEGQEAFNRAVRAAEDSTGVHRGDA